MTARPLAPQVPASQRPGLVAHLLAAIPLALLLAASGRAEAQLPGATAPRVVLVLGVGAAFVLVGAATSVPLLPRALAVATGTAWLLASLEPLAQRLHQGLLLVTLVTLASGRLRGWIDRLVTLAAAAVALLLVPQPAVVALLALVAVLAAWRGRNDRLEWYSAVAAAVVASVLGIAWFVSHRTPETFRPDVALVAYETVLLLVALGIPVASRGARAYRSRLAERVLQMEAGTGLDGLATVLQAVLRDPTLRIRRVSVGGPDMEVPTITAPPAEPPRPSRRLAVHEGMSTVAEVEHSSSVLDDSVTADSVASAVRLVRLHELLQQELRAELDRLTQARTRLIASRDDQRAATAARLRTDVVRLLAEATTDVGGTRASVVDPGTAAALELVEAELQSASREVLDLVAGVPPADLGNGRLVAAVRDLARQSPVPVDVVVHGRPGADAASESALFYVCSEALTNAAKHARPTAVTVAIRDRGAVLEVEIRDDGIGGADPRGSGFQGLADRLAGHRGRLDVRSAPGSGTTVTASVDH